MATSRRTNWSLLAVVVSAPVLIFGVLTLLHHTQMPPPPTPTPGIPLLVSEACGPLADDTGEPQAGNSRPKNANVCFQALVAAAG
jgi:hypothetical protein